MFPGRLISNFLSLLLLQGTNFLLPFISYPYLFRTVGVEQYGLLMFCFAFIQYFIILTDFGFNLSATREISISRENIYEMKELYNSTMAAKFVILLAAVLILIIVIPLIEKLQENQWFIWSFFGMVLGQVMFPIWFFQGIEKMKTVTVINIGMKLLSIIPIFLFVKNSSDLFLVPIFYSIGYLMAGITGLIVAYYRFGMRLYFTSWDLILMRIKASADFFMSRVSVSLFSISNTFILGLTSGNINVGFYNASEKIYQAFKEAYSPLINTIYPYMSKERKVILFKKILIFTVFFNFLCVTIAFIYTEEIIYLIYNTVDPRSVDVLRVLLAGCIVVVPSALIGYPFLGAFGFTRITNLTVIIPSIIHITGLVVLYLLNEISPINIARLLVVTELLVFISRLTATIKLKLWNF